MCLLFLNPFLPCPLVGLRCYGLFVGYDSVWTEHRSFFHLNASIPTRMLGCVCWFACGVQQLQGDAATARLDAMNAKAKAEKAKKDARCPNLSPTHTHTRARALNVYCQTHALVHTLTSLPNNPRRRTILIKKQAALAKEQMQRERQTLEQEKLRAQEREREATKIAAEQRRAAAKAEAKRKAQAKRAEERRKAEEKAAQKRRALELAEAKRKAAAKKAAERQKEKARQAAKRAEERRKAAEAKRKAEAEAKLKAEAERKAEA